MTNSANAIFNHIKQKSPTETSFITTTKEIKSIIHKLPEKKAQGPDQITNKTLKNLPRKTVGILITLINSIISTTHFPGTSKKAEEFMILKPGKDLKLPKNHWPISLISTIGNRTHNIYSTS